MGMFDYIFVKEDFLLPELPEIVSKHWGGRQSKIAFQTKDTPNQGMSAYVIGNDGVLYLNEYDSEFVKDESILGFYEVRSNERLETTNFSGKIRFYEFIYHEDYTFDDSDRFEGGWLEYLAEFDRGVLTKPIELVENTPAKKLTDEELQEKVERREKVWQENRNRNIEFRKNKPSPHQKLIDNIAREIKLATCIPTMEDYGKALNNIELYIKEYREKYDTFYK